MTDFTAFLLHYKMISDVVKILQSMKKEGRIV